MELEITYDGSKVLINNLNSAHAKEWRELGWGIIGCVALHPLMPEQYAGGPLHSTAGLALGAMISHVRDGKEITARSLYTIPVPAMGYGVGH